MSSLSVNEPQMPNLVDTICPICETATRDKEVYGANFTPDDLNKDVFSARRLPDRLHYRMVRCGSCGLLRSNPILSNDELAHLYEKSHFTYGGEARYTGKTYARYLKRARRVSAVSSPALLEIGAGSGFFLGEARKQGIENVTGVEPSGEAIANADASLRPRIRQGLYDAGTFPADSFDIACAFQVFDHVADPLGIVRAAFKHLRRGGVALFINHDSGALTNRLLGERSPIVDVEHTALYDKRTMRLILEKAGFNVREVFSVANTYPLSYWARLAPMPKNLKSSVLSLLQSSFAGEIPVKLRAGNLGAIATKD